MNKINTLTVVVSVYNEEEVLEIFWSDLEESLKRLGLQYEVIFVNDGSTDNSQDILRRLSKVNNNIKVVNLSMNFGHEAAMTAGIDYSTGDAVVCMDADLQHPPSMLSEMVLKFTEGYEIVNMVRGNNEGFGILKRVTSGVFYYVLNMISKVRFEPNASDFFLISKRVAEILSSNFSERTRFLRGFIQTVGFRKATLEFVAPKRAAGTSKYSLFKLFAYAIKAIAAFSNLPLRIGLLFGTVVGIFSVLVGIYSIIMKMLGYVTPGYTTIVVLVSFLFAIQFFITGIIGEYLGFLFRESKRRPIYIVQDEINIQSDDK
jgi:glycosyltransferase involved in cell wall biosynthesis